MLVNVSDWFNSTYRDNFIPVGVRKTEETLARRSRRAGEECWHHSQVRKNRKCRFFIQELTVYLFFLIIILLPIEIQVEIFFLALRNREKLSRRTRRRRQTLRPIRMRPYQTVLLIPCPTVLLLLWTPRLRGSCP